MVPLDMLEVHVELDARGAGVEIGVGVEGLSGTKEEEVGEDVKSLGETAGASLLCLFFVVVVVVVVAGSARSIS